MRRAIVLVVVMLGAVGLLSAPRGRAAEKGPIKIGFLYPQSGPLAANGKDMANGMALFLEERKNSIAGREVQLLVEDSEGKPATGLTKTRSLVEGQGINVLVGPLSAAVGYAIAPYLTEKKVATLFPIVSSEDITQRKRSAYVVRTGWSSAQPSQPFGKWVWD